VSCGCKAIGLHNARIILEMQIPVASWSELKHAGLLRENAPIPRAQHKIRKALIWQASPGNGIR
jgi:hypothetical protein